MPSLELRINGTCSAWMAEFGHDCPRCNEIRSIDPYRVANASWSLIQRGEDGRLLRHTLIDVGLGVVQSLLDFERTHEVHLVHEVLLSHSHFDHVAHLDWLSSSIRRNGRPDQPRPLPVYCTPRCWEIGPARLFPWLVNKAIRHVPIEPERSVDLGQLRVTPMGVEHGSTAPGAVGFVADWRPEPASGAPPRRISFTCDLQRVTKPAASAWRDTDICFMEAHNWNRNPDTGHHSIQDALDLIRQWRPRRTYLVHYSGHEDARHAHSSVRGPLLAAQLEEYVRSQAPGLDIRVARQGVMIPADEPWPG